jgi:hypothetical protein
LISPSPRPRVTFGPAFFWFVLWFIPTPPRPSPLYPPTATLCWVGLPAISAKMEKQPSYKLLNPSPRAYLETLLTGVPTSYSALYATTLALALEHPKTGLDAGHDQAIHLCEDYTERLQAHRP